MISQYKDGLILQFLEDPFYHVDEFGNVFTRRPEKGSLKADVDLSTIPWRKLFMHTDGCGYRSIRYKKKFIRVHRIVHSKFVGKLTHLLEVNHKDGDPSNNCYTNLEAMDHSANMKHSYETLGREKVTARRKFHAEHIQEIRRLYSEGAPITYLAEKYGTVKSSIFYIVTRKTYRDIKP